MAAETPESGLVDSVVDIFLFYFLNFIRAPSFTMDESTKEHHKPKVSGIGLQLWGRIRNSSITSKVELQ
jgi:hypothetical protein